MASLENGEGTTDATRVQRRRASRLIDRVSDVLGHEVTFVVVVVGDLLVLVMIALVGTSDGPVLSTTALVVSLVTLIMVCAVQHTSSREAKALNLKLDELIRVSPGRNELIGAEDESHRQLESRATYLREQHRAGDER
jgi:low affinity Fe/Cu permease